MNNKLLQKVRKIVPPKEIEELLRTWDPIIKINRTIRPEYPDFAKKVLYPKLFRLGPTKFDVRTLLRWKVHKERKIFFPLYEILEELVAKKLIGQCLGLAELMAILERGNGFFRKYFPEENDIFGWKSVVADDDDRLIVPCLNIYGAQKIELDWYCLHEIETNSPTLMYATDTSTNR